MLIVSGFWSCNEFSELNNKSIFNFHQTGHDDSIVHGILTENNLFDGSIITPTENYYIEPASRYSSELIDNGIHTIVYKTSDVHMLPHQKSPSSTDPTTKHYCASQRLHEKMKNRRNNNKHQLYDALDIELSDKNTINEPVPSEHLSRSKRWLADEVSHSAYFLLKIGEISQQM